MKLSVTWKNQGWGNSKGRLKIVLVNGPDELKSKEIFGLAPNQWEDEEIELNAQDEIIQEFSRSDSYKIYYKVGSGGGH